MPLRALAALSDKERERGKKKPDRQWLELNIVLSGHSQHPLQGHIFYTEIIASVRVALEWESGILAHVMEPEVVWLPGNCFLEVAPLLQTCIIERKIDANIRLTFIRDCLSEISHLDETKRAYNKWHQNHRFYNHHLKTKKRFADQNFNIAKLDQKGFACRLHLHQHDCVSFHLMHVMQ